MSIWNDIKEKFTPFITLPLFLLGIVLLLLGITTGVNIPTQGISLISEPSFRAISIIIGSICIVLCLILNLAYKKPVVIIKPPKEWEQPLLNRAANLTPTQSNILKYIREKTENSSSNLGEIELGQQFKKGGSEIYYRLEQLRLLGLISKSTLGGAGTNYYRLSDPYKEALASSSSSKKG